MKRKINLENLLVLVLDDRFRAFTRFDLEVPKKKMLNIDLIGKMLMFYRNSIGKIHSEAMVFVDEVQNGSMIGIMENSIRHCAEPYSIMNFREVKGKEHVKLGYFFPFFNIIAVIISQAFFIIFSTLIGLEKANRYSSAALIRKTEKIIDRVHKLGGNNVYVMTDHNFYSTIICNNKEIKSNVLQHGLIMDKSFYKVVLADRFCAWGKRSRELLDNDGRIEVTGTYKFDGLRDNSRKCEEKSILFFVSDMDFEKVAEKISDILIHVAKCGYQLKVKLHPGSFFSNTGLKEKFPDVQFYKEEKIWDIDFSVGVVDNSTVLIDLLYLEKPYVIFNKDAGYFEPYHNIPVAHNASELFAVLQAIDSIDYSSVSKLILFEELNDEKCNIFRQV